MKMRKQRLMGLAMLAITALILVKMCIRDRPLGRLDLVQVTELRRRLALFFG